MRSKVKKFQRAFPQVKIKLTEKDEIRYPIKISEKLKIMNLGRIDLTKKGCCDGQFIYPIGFSAIRTAKSILKPSSKVDYECEIIEGPRETPRFRVTCMTKPDFEIVERSP